MNEHLLKKLVAGIIAMAGLCPVYAWTAEEWAGDGPEVPAPAADASAGEQGGDAMFKSIFGPDFKISGGTIRYLPERKAVLIRDYATVLIQGRRIRARNIIYFTEINRLYAEGEVSIEESNGSFMTCEQVYFDIREGRGRARQVNLRKSNQPVNSMAPVEETDVTLYRPDVDDNAPSAMDVFAEDDDTMKNMRMNVFANDLRVVSKNHFEATNAWASPSNYAEPHWRIASKAVHVRPDEKVEAYHNLFKIGKIPVFYFPYLVYDLRYNWPYYRPSVGSDGRHGFYFLNRLGWEFSNPTDDNGRAVDENGQLVRRYFQLDKIFFDADYRSKRGWGLGGETDYSVDFLGKGKGNFKGYWTKEIYITSDEDHDRAEDDVEFRSNVGWENTRTGKPMKPSYYGNENRYSLEWQHTHDLPFNLDLRAQVHHFSDRDFYKDYFRDDWSKEEDKKTNANLRYLGDLFSSDFTVQMRLNDFRTETEYLPQWKLSLPGVRLFEQLPLYLESKTDATLGRRLHDNMLKNLDLVNSYRSHVDPLTGKWVYGYDGRDRNKNNGQSPWVGRLHEEAIVSLPLDLKVLSIKPWAGGFLTGYSTSFNPQTQGDDNAQLNGAVKWGVDFSSRFFGELGQSWTHVIEPTVSFLNHEDPLVNRDYLYELDAIDDYRNSRMVTFGLHQDFYKKNAAGKERLILSANLKTGYILDDDEAKRYNNRENMANISFDAALHPTETWSLWGNCVYSPAASEVTSVGAGTDFWFNKKMRMFINHYYTSGYDENNPSQRYNSSNLTTFAIRTQLWNKLSHYAIEYGLSYQWNDDAGSLIRADHYEVGEVKNGLQKQRISLIRDLDTFEAAVTYAHDFNDNDWTVYVNLMPKNWVGVKRAPDAGTSVTLDQNWDRYSHPVPERMVNNTNYQYDTTTPSWQ